jgi:hypothetical protein
MDHRRSVRSVEVPGSIRPQDQESQRVLPDFFDHQRVFHAMLDVLVVDACRRLDGRISTAESYYETQRSQQGLPAT